MVFFIVVVSGMFLLAGNTNIFEKLCIKLPFYAIMHAWPKQNNFFPLNYAKPHGKKEIE